MVSHPWVRAAFFLVWAAYMAWIAFEGLDRWFLRWPMVLFALTALGIAVHFARIGSRRRRAP